MAKTMHSIQMDFQKAKNQAERLERIAKELGNAANQNLSGCMRDISSEWKGENAGVYVRKGYSVADGLNSAASGLNQAAAAIRTIAQNTYNAEKRAIELARARKYRQQT